MSRQKDEWVGATDDSQVPPRVRIRVFERDGGRCQCGCGTLIRPGDKWETDHTTALINNGENRERNLRTLLASHHKGKTRLDVKLKAKVARVRMRHAGIRPTRVKIQSRGFSKAPPQRKASTPIEKWRGF